MLNPPHASSDIESALAYTTLLKTELAPTVGISELSWSDHKMEYRAAVWYPAEKCASTPIKYLDAFPAHAVPHAYPYGRGHPLVLISHGFGGSRYDQAYLAEYLAARGCVCLAPSYPDRIGSERWRLLINRPYTLQMAYQQFISSSVAARVDLNCLVLIAHSAGAYPTLIAAGARPRFDLEPVFERILPFLESFDPESFDLDGVQNIILMAPALSNLFDAYGLSRVDKPTLIIAAELEKVHLLGTAQAYANQLRNSQLCLLKDAGHYAFINEFPPLLAKLSPRKAGGDRRNRSALHAEVLSLIDRQFTQLPTSGRGRVK